MKTILFISLIGFTLFSCADFDRDKLLQRVDKQQKQLNGLNMQLEKYVMKDVASLKNDALQTELRIKQNLHLDTINMELARQLEEFKLMRKSISPLMKQYLKAKNGIKEEEAVLKNLSRDIQEGRGERQRYEEYIQFEKQKVSQLSALTKDYLKARSKFIADHKRLYPPIEAFSYTLIQKRRK
jgi:hypothetical protein